MREKLFRLLSSAWFIALVAMVLRVAYLISKARAIPAVVLATVPFQNEAGNVAAALAQGKGFCCLFREPTGPTAWLAPVYPLFLACIFKLFGKFTLASFYAAVLSNCVFSSIACFPLFRAASRVGGNVCAALACWIWAFFSTGIILPSEWIWDTSLSALLAVAVLWATLELADSSHARDFALYGVLWGFTLLTNPTLGILLPFLLGWIFIRRVSLQQIRLVGLALLMILLLCLPWSLRNYAQFHRFIPLRSNFPYELWSGNNEIFDEHSREVNRITRYEQVHLYSELGENEFLEQKWEKARNFISTHRELYRELVERRILQTWLGSEHPLQDFEQSESLLVRFLLFWNAVTLVGVIAGLVWLYLRRRSYFVPVAAFPLLFPLTFYIAHTSLRHRHPCDPILALLMALAVVEIGTRKKQE